MSQRLTQQERRIRYTSILQGNTLVETNRLLKMAGFREMPGSTYILNSTKEAILFRRRPELLEVFVARPIPYGDWPLEWRA